jgi:hypothetical protein
MTTALQGNVKKFVSKINWVVFVKRLEKLDMDVSIQVVHVALTSIKFHLKEQKLNITNSST